MSKKETAVTQKIQWELTKFFQRLKFVGMDEMTQTTFPIKRLRILSKSYVKYDFDDRIKAAKFIKLIHAHLVSQGLIVAAFENRQKGAKQTGFYQSKEWRILRYQVLRHYERKCMCCGRTPQDHGIVLHVDHIKPRAKYPLLALRFDNVQILCEDCNLGKMDTDTIDYRPKLRVIKKIMAFRSYSYS